MILDRLGGVDDEGNEEPIEARMLSRQIEKAQQKVEEQNFLMRKRVLEYDDVLNEQRRVIYAYRDEVLEGKSIGEEARSEIAAVIERTMPTNTPEGDYLEDLGSGRWLPWPSGSSSRAGAHARGPGARRDGRTCTGFTEQIVELAR